jgi:putative endonuclease
MASGAKESTRAKGFEAETIAAEFLGRAGFTIIDRNFRVGRNEIDLIAQKANLTVFVEVKARSLAQFGHPETTLSEAQLDRIRAAATVWQEQNAYTGLIRFDIIAVSWVQEQPQIRHFMDV